MRTFRDAKLMAKALRAELSKRSQVDLSHGECLDIVSRQHGLDNWNVLSPKIDELASTGDDGSGPMSTTNATIPLFRIFSADKAREFYVDFFGFSLDFGGPTGPDGTAFYGQVSRAGTTLHLTETAYDPSPGSTVLIWMQGLDDLHTELNRKRETMRVYGPGIWVPWPEEVGWGGGARTLTITDPFGNSLRFVEPIGEADRTRLASWHVPQPSTAR